MIDAKLYLLVLVLSVTKTRHVASSTWPYITYSTPYVSSEHTDEDMVMDALEEHIALIGDALPPLGAHEDAD